MVIALALVAGMADAAERTRPPGWQGYDVALAEARADICRHYVNRAKFKDRHPDQEFVVTLADACLEAKASTLHGSEAEKAAAEAFLVRLQTLKDTVIEINMRRVFGEGYGPRTRVTYGKGAMSETMRRVSALGEYLIAYEMGLIDAYRAWLGTGPKLTLALPNVQRR